MNNLRLFIWIIYKMFLWQRQPLLQTFQNIWCLHCGVFTERFDWRFHLRVYLEGCWLESVFTWVFFTFGRHVFIVEEFFTWECFDFESLPSSWTLWSWGVVHLRVFSLEGSSLERNVLYSWGIVLLKVYSLEGSSLERNVCSLLRVCSLFLFWVVVFTFDVFHCCYL